MDKIFIRGLDIYAYHGVFDEERSQGQQFILDITINLYLKKAGISDCLADTINYAEVVETVKHEFTRTAYNLLESAAYAVGKRILEDFQSVETVTICLQKPDAPINAKFKTVGIEVNLER